jgi:hypothetical protein
MNMMSYTLALTIMGNMLGLIHETPLEAWKRTLK